MKLPTFWSANPKAWFAQAEAQFALRHISNDDTKYYHIISALDSDTATRALSILSQPPETDKYKAIKDFLVDAFDLSDYERASKLLNTKGLGDSKPSELMDYMLALLGDHKPCFLFKFLFLQQLPTSIRTALSSATITDYRQLALEADKYYLSSQSPVVQNTESVALNSVVPDPTISVVSRDRPQPQPAPHTRVSRADATNHLCWYHRKYGQKARRCEQPCSFTNSGNAKPGQ